ncbi:MAG: EamA family transporter RarD [Pirellula sp.]
MHEKHFGYLRAISAYTLWGVFPLYWKLMPEVGSVEVICHRILFSLITLVACITLVRQWDSIAEVLTDRNRSLLCALAAVLISINWLVFIWSVQNDYVIEGSLGYFINPLLTVLLAVVLFRERISRLQWISISLAFLGVAIMTIEAGRFPWFAFFLSTSFASYAAVKKKTTLPAIAGLGMETAILAPISIGLLFYFLRIQNTAESRSITTWSLLALGGPITTLPLVLFASAAQKVPLVAMGMLQYVGPSLQFLLGLFWFREDVSTVRFVGFGFVWVALVLFTWGTILLEREKRLAQ